MNHKDSATNGNVDRIQGRGTHDAIERAREHVAAANAGSAIWTWRSSLSRVNHDILMPRLADPLFAGGEYGGWTGVAA
jgi:hypothetical protein